VVHQGGAFGEVQVMDWGLAKVLTDRGAPAAAPPDGEAPAPATVIEPDRDDLGATRAGSVLGTPAYMAPEQAIGAVDQTDRRSDVFGLGALLCQILTGQPPYLGTDVEAVRQLAARGRQADALARLDGCGAGPGLVDLCRRCLAPEPAGRPADAGEVARAVAELRAAADERARRAELDRVRAEGARARAEAEAREQRRRRRSQLALASAVGLLLAGGGAFAWWQAEQARGARERLGRNAEAVADLLDQGEAALRAGDAAKAAVALEAAQKRAAEGGADDLAGRLEQRRADLAVLRALEEIDQFRWTWDGKRLPDAGEVAARLRGALERFGVAPGQTPPEEAARRVGGSAVRDRLVAALDRWLAAERSADVRAVLRAAGPDDYRDVVRDAVLAGDKAALAELAGRSEALAQPGGFAAVLGENRAVPAGRRRQLLRAALVRQPGDLGLLMTLGLTYPSNQREGAEERLRWFQAAVAAHPSAPAPLVDLGIALADKGDLDGALACFKEAVRLDPKLAPAHNNLGTALRDRDDLDGALACFKEAVRLDPKYATAHYNMGNVLRARGDPDGAVVAYEEAVRLDPKHAPARYNLGNALRERGDLDGAVVEYEAAIRLDPRPARAQNNLGLALRDKGDLDGAIARYKEAIRLDPKLASAHNNLGSALRDRDDLDGALACFKEAVRVGPRDASARTNLRVTERWRGLLPRLPDVADGRAGLATPADGCEAASLLSLPFQKRYAAAVRLYRRAFAADPKLADTRSFNAARCAALAAAGKDADLAAFGADEWWHLTDLAGVWLRAELALLVTRANDPKDRAQVIQRLIRLKRGPGLGAVRDPAWLAAMPAAERAAWQAFWAEVDVVLASVVPPRRGGP
jgi:tetratricopeptide (TPR) repeat protein